MGACSWHCSPKIMSELGWMLSGAGRAVADVACRRCVSHLLDDTSDLYKCVFLGGHVATGAKLSLDLLMRWGMQAWPQWGISRSRPSTYKAYVRQAVGGRCVTHTEFMKQNSTFKHIPNELKTHNYAVCPMHHAKSALYTSQVQNMDK